MSTVHFTTATTAKRTAHGMVHQGTLKDSDRVTIDDILLTSRSRSICDTARIGTVEQAVCALDSGLHLGVPRHEIDEQVERLRRHNGAPILRAAMPLVDGRAESVGETVSRLALAQDPQIPPPDLQVEIWVDLNGRKRVRSDYGWRDKSGKLCVVGEFDGRVKYHRSNPFSDELPEEVIYQEKLREDAIRDTGPRVVRWTWSEARRRPRTLHARVLSALRAEGVIP
ncbi:hypothetical protein AAFP30_00420 [Gordonia sp. CPCC 205515]|uniref:hypothetical protein n=1 Tax=Gordonia sp. CPCC 205515 TaxID=3140791 RepID=UPI003AF3F65D